MNDRVYNMTFASIYPLYINKAEKKGRTRQEVDEVLIWLTGYSADGLKDVIDQELSLHDFIDEAPQLHPNRRLITGVICGKRVEDIEEPLMQEIRYMDKLIDELAKGKKMEKILRG